MQLQERIPAQSAEASDGVLVGQALAGDERAFETLVRRYHGLLFASIYRYMRDYDQACDVLQHVWLQTLSFLANTPYGQTAGSLATSGCPEPLPGCTAQE